MSVECVQLNNVRRQGKILDCLTYDIYIVVYIKRYDQSTVCIWP